MKELAQLLNAMLQAGVIRSYAVFGAVAQISGNTNGESIRILAAQHGLANAWEKFESKFLNE